MLNLNPKPRPTAESVAKQLDAVLHDVVDKINAGEGPPLDMEALLSQQASILSREAQTANSLVSEALVHIASRIPEINSTENTKRLSPFGTTENNGTTKRLSPSTTENSINRQNSRKLSPYGTTEINVKKLSPYGTTENGPKLVIARRSASYSAMDNIGLELASEKHLPAPRRRASHGVVRRNNTAQPVKKSSLNSPFALPLRELTSTDPVRPGNGITVFRPMSARERNHRGFSSPSPSTSSSSYSEDSAYFPEDSLFQESTVTLTESVQHKTGEKLEGSETLQTSGPRIRYGTVLYSFEPENEGELAVEADDHVKVLEVKGEWVECITEDQRHGWIPYNYVLVDR